MLHPMPTRCPITGDELIVTRLYCRNSGITIEGQFKVSGFHLLTEEQLAFVEMFVRNEGKITRMEAELGLSYPTIRSRLHDVIRALGYEPRKDATPEPPALSDEARRQILEDLDSGKITAEEAMARLNPES